MGTGKISQLFSKLRKKENEIEMVSELEPSFAVGDIMPDITSPELIQHVTEERLAANAYVQLYWLAKQLQINWTANGLVQKFPTDTSLIVDGELAHPATSVEVRQFMVLLDAFVTQAESNTNADLKKALRLSTYPID